MHWHKSDLVCYIANVDLNTVETSLKTKDVFVSELQWKEHQVSLNTGN